MNKTRKARAAPKTQLERVTSAKPYQSSVRKNKTRLNRPVTDRPHRCGGVYIGVCTDCGKSYLRCECKLYMSALRFGRTRHDI
jgi:hypothetical protein